MKLIFAAFWILLGGAIFYYEHQTGETNFKFRGIISSAWLAVLLAVYNLVGWWNYRVARARERAVATQEQKQYARGRRKHPEEGTNPDFDFKNPPTSPG